MADTRPGPDELRVRDILRTRGVGPDADEPDLPDEPDQLPDGYQQAPADDPDAWWDRLYAGEQPKPDSLPAPPDSDEDEADDEDEPDAEAEPDKAPTPRKRSRRSIKRPRTSLADATADMSPKNRWLLLHCTAAAAGWPIGLVTWGTNTAAWFAADHWTDSSAWVLYGLATVTLRLYQRTRHSGPLLAWLAAIPVSSVTCGVLLYGTAA